MAARIPDEVRRGVWLAVAAGQSYSQVAVEFGISPMSVSRIRHDDSVKADVYRKCGARLCLADREEISRALAEDITMSDAEIALRVGCDRTTIWRELKRNGGRLLYRAVDAQRRADAQARRPKPTKFERHPALAVVVEDWLEEHWSPEQIHGRLVHEFPDDGQMRVSHETIYQALYVHTRGGLRKELARELRTHRTHRRPRTETARNRKQSPIPNPVSIAERPEEINLRLIPGHWEGDLILGRDAKSQVLTAVERTTGLVMLGKLDTKTANEAAAKLQELIEGLPDYLRGSITWDRGSEMAAHESFTIATGVKVYFCDPHSPWQRGSNENTNGLLRQYLPRNTDLSVHSQHDLDQIAHSLNTRPRKRHDFMTPLEVFNQLVLH